MSTVYLLGAGFSRGVGAPLLREVMKKGILDRADQSRLLEVRVWLEQLFAPDRGVESLDFEEVLSRLDLEIHYRRSGQDELILIRQELVSLFLDALEQCSNRTLPREYLDFVGQLGDGDTVINLNYDLVLEKALRVEGRFYPDYGLDCLEVQGGKAFPVLKPHGSLNLYYCPSCFRIDLLETQIYSGVTDKYNLRGSCGHFLRPLVITPTLYKSYSLPQLREVWFRFLKALTKGERIVFIGYSLPKADILVAQTLDFAQRLNKKRPLIEVVNGPNPDIGEISRLYQGKVKNRKLDFREWVNSQ
jgi:hypothetical protein